ncbi:MAG: hypothetical protein ACREMO_03530, partial [Gemmatimonadales bacterium]
MAALLVLVLLPRVLALGADPPADFHFHFLDDEGWWAHNAYLHARFGRWVMDDLNPSLFAAPAYTVVLAGVYRAFGIGLAQTRLLSGLSGFLTCLLLYVLLRTRLSPGRALVPALSLGLSYFMLSNNRVGFTESFQLLLITASFAAIVHSARHSGWAVTGGVCFVLALLAKPSAIAMAPVFVGFWAAHFLFARRLGFAVPFSFRSPVLFSLAALGTLLSVAILLVLPNWDAVKAALAVNLRMAYAGTGDARILLFGWEGLGLVVNGFFIQSAVLLLAVVLVAIGRLAGTIRTPPDLTELFSWVWLVGTLLFLAAQRYQPDRRFLLLMPPVAIVASLALREGVYLPARGTLSGDLAWWRRALIGGLIGGFVGIFAVPVLGKLGVIATAGVGWSQAEATMVWTTCVLVGIVTMPAACALLPQEPRRLAGAWLWVLFLVYDPGRFLVYTTHLTYTFRDASRALASLSAAWKPAEQVMTGKFADSFALDTKIFSFTIRRWPFNQSYANVDGWERFRPSIVLVETSDKSPEDLVEIRQRGFLAYREFKLWPDRHG